MRLSDAGFWALTPLQFELLWREHLESRSHTEMVHAWTTTAVRNKHPMAVPEPVSPLEFMPSHRLAAQAEPEVELTEDQQREVSEMQQRIAQLAAEIRKGGGALLDRIYRGEGV